MRFLLDTHILIWWLNDPSRLPHEIDRLLTEKPHSVAVSVISSWEIMIKKMKGKLGVPSGFWHAIRQSDMPILPLGLNHVETLEQLAPIHGDPFDRMLVAQALSENLTFITADAALADYPIKVKFVAL